MEAGDSLVSVIIPVYNNAKRLRRTLAALENQTYPAGRYEVIVVDNGSTDESPEVARAFAGVRLLYERERRSSPYSARNRGIEAASGEVIALLDATCVPVAGWIEEGVACLRAQQAELVGGQVEFAFRNEKPTAGEMYDALTNIQMRQSVAQNKAKTANLFVRRDVIDAVGMFPEGIRSGGDVRWTRQATREGYKLVFCEGAMVYKSARRVRALVKKQWRVGKGKAAVRKQEGRAMSVVKLLILAVLPPGFAKVKEKAEERGYLKDRSHAARLWLVRYAIDFVMKMGEGYATLRNEWRRRKSSERLH